MVHFTIGVNSFSRPGICNTTFIFSTLSLSNCEGIGLLMTDMGTLYTFQTKLESLVYYLFVQRTRFENICNKQISTNLFYSIAMN
jgi:hypothetical protein